jgi:hypothetical protein
MFDAVDTLLKKSMIHVYLLHSETCSKTSNNHIAATAALFLVQGVTHFFRFKENLTSAPS